MTQTADLKVHQYESHSAKETIAAGHRIAELLIPPKFLILRGDLGAGKTTLVKGIAEALDAAVEACLADILACGAGAIRQQKALIQAWERLPLADAVAAGVETFADAYRTDEPRAMMAEFLASQAARKGG